MKKPLGASSCADVAFTGMLFDRQYLANSTCLCSATWTTLTLQMSSNSVTPHRPTPDFLSFRIARTGSDFDMVSFRRMSCEDVDGEKTPLVLDETTNDRLVFRGERFQDTEEDTKWTETITPLTEYFLTTLLDEDYGESTKPGENDGNHNAQNSLTGDESFQNRTRSASPLDSHEDRDLYSRLTRPSPSLSSSLSIQSGLAQMITNLQEDQQACFLVPESEFGDELELLRGEFMASLKEEDDHVARSNEENDSVVENRDDEHTYATEGDSVNSGMVVGPSDVADTGAALQYLDKPLPDVPQDVHDEPVSDSSAGQELKESYPVNVSLIEPTFLFDANENGRKRVKKREATVVDMSPRHIITDLHHEQQWSEKGIDAFALSPNAPCEDDAAVIDISSSKVLLSLAQAQAIFGHGQPIDIPSFPNYVTRQMETAPKVRPSLIPLEEAQVLFKHAESFDLPSHSSAFLDISQASMSEVSGSNETEIPIDSLSLEQLPTVMIPSLITLEEAKRRFANVHPLDCASGGKSDPQPQTQMESITPCVTVSRSASGRRMLKKKKTGDLRLWPKRDVKKEA
ncbi:hypothetical protein EW146_g5358 [Bondarzewia mesenterica]|uniref:Uncharacterized protein n=1 Tax=Bondarzewia mesenterica TaxID=1095465 RepID=A0A4S4LSU4_9AGAM|nr:hypothetical protein EW146_g5358 [Bondarzewia mesenterica]